MKNRVVLFSIVCYVVLTGCSAANKARQSGERESWINTSLQKAVSQYKYLAATVPNGVLPRTYLNDKLVTTVSKNWVAGFYPGTLLYLYKGTKNQAMYAEAVKRIVQLDQQQYMTSNHDIGFMMYCSYGNLYAIDPQEKYKKILINSARSLTQRYSSVVKAIRSWGQIEDDKEFVVIIDNMMNLELLMWAFKVTGEPVFRDIAVNHANTSLKNHFRSDNSSFHLVVYCPKTGSIIQKKTAQGATDESAWARGQAWGLYGYTMMYRETGDKNYLEQAKKIAGFILSHPNLPQDKIPYWDFNAPRIPNTPRDASAGAIIASALLELSGFTDGELAQQYFNAAAQILSNLASEDYTSEIGANGGFILKHSVSHFPKGNDVDAPLSYADYYFIEALLRLKNYGGFGKISKQNN